MKHLITLIATIAAASLSAQTISTLGFTFSPNLLTVLQGDEISLNIGGGHTMTEVSEATWNANGGMSNGGFNFGSGNHTLTLDVPGTYYYVCQPHAGLDMKGRIVVEINTGIEARPDNNVFQLFPNPASEGISVTMPGAHGMVLRLIDMQGREVLNHRLIGDDRIGIAHLAKGNYTAVVEDANGNSVARRLLTITR